MVVTDCCMLKLYMYIVYIIYHAWYVVQQVVLWCQVHSAYLI